MVRTVARTTFGRKSLKGSNLCGKSEEGGSAASRALGLLWLLARHGGGELLTY